jgi:hypothetical protein
LSGPEVPVEVAQQVDRADNGVQRYRLQAQVPLAAPAERANDLVEHREPVAVLRLAAQAVGQRGQEVVPLAAEVVAGVCQEISICGASPLL